MHEVFIKGTVVAVVHPLYEGCAMGDPCVTGDALDDQLTGQESNGWHDAYVDEDGVLILVKKND